MEPLRIAAVSYLNTLPFVHGLRQVFGPGEAEITLDTPAACTDRLLSGDADVGLVPVAALAGGRLEAVSDFCIAADGRVDSVLLLSQEPLASVRTVFLDYQSLTSVALVRVLEEHRWKTGVRFTGTRPGYEKELTGDRAGLVIGDRALALRHSFEHVLDLAAEWKAMTGMPFVFACWAAPGPLDADRAVEFNRALDEGVRHAGGLWDPRLEPHMNRQEQAEYLTRRVHYRLDDEKRKALKRFLELAAPYLTPGARPVTHPR